MKTKAKLTLAISVMSAAVLAAGVTSTFAWLTTQQTANVNYANMTVSTVSSIKVSVKQLAYVPKDWSDAGPSYDGSADLGLVSSVDGKDFFAPKALKTEDSYAKGDMAQVETQTDWTSEIADVTGVKNIYVGYVKYVVHVTSPADTTANNLNLRFKFEVNADSGISSSWRLGFFSATSTSTSTTFGDLIDEKIYANSDSTSSLAGYKNGATTIEEGSYSTMAVPAAATLLTADDSTYVNTTDGIDAYYGVSIWIDGKVANNDAGGNKLSAKLTFDLVSGDKDIS